MNQMLTSRLCFWLSVFSSYFRSTSPNFTAQCNEVSSSDNESATPPPPLPRRRKASGPPLMTRSRQVRVPFTYIVQVSSQNSTGSDCKAPLSLPFESFELTVSVHQVASWLRELHEQPCAPSPALTTHFYIKPRSRLPRLPGSSLESPRNRPRPLGTEATPRTINRR